MFNSGFEASVIDGSEIIFDEPQNIGLPKEFSYIKYLPKVVDQGQNPTCVPCSISAYLNWETNLEDGVKKDNSIDIFELFRNGEGTESGMSFKKAFKALQEKGVTTNKGVLKINKYAKINSFLSLKYALITNGSY
jgi:hypothetical protein